MDIEHPPRQLCVVRWTPAPVGIHGNRNGGEQGESSSYDDRKDGSRGRESAGGEIILFSFSFSDVKGWEIERSFSRFVYGVLMAWIYRYKNNTMPACCSGMKGTRHMVPCLRISANAPASELHLTLNFKIGHNC